MKKILLSLKNSLEREDLKEKIRETEESIREFANEMEEKGFWKVARFFRSYIVSCSLLTRNSKA